MTYLEGDRLRDILEVPQEYRNRMAVLAFQAWYHPFFHHGVIHGDPHLGNYSFRSLERHGDEGINLFDFGCVRRFESSFIHGVQELYHALDTKDSAREVHAFETLGFKGLTKDVLAVLRLWATLLYEPVLDDRVRPMQQDHSGVYGREMAEKVHQELKKLGGVEPPREFVFMDRAAVGVGSLCLHLRAEANWCRLYRALLTGTCHLNQA
jgi:predicted unusual protein kinase regulating ubiquinone biosynthesis (AarF/ABC1/UbiB family)